MNRFARGVLVTLSTGLTFLAVTGSAQAATVSIQTAKTPVVYATQGNPGYSDPRTKPGYMVIMNGAVQWKESWRTWGTTAKSRRAKEKDCGAGCTNWVRTSLRFYKIGYHTIKNIGGSKIRIKFYRCLEADTAGNLIYYQFGTQTGTRLPVWSLVPNGGSC